VRTTVPGVNDDNGAFGLFEDRGLPILVARDFDDFWREPSSNSEHVQEYRL